MENIKIRRTDEYEERAMTESRDCCEPVWEVFRIWSWRNRLQVQNHLCTSLWRVILDIEWLTGSSGHNEAVAIGAHAVIYRS
ncbi:hypothetical protein LQV63_14740 [Paenibacillus profundus]|uniref:Uncharacterized protein n=1 Tax=Paenibacillus profundus TaxID=1173085 RepID=A0ABS8YEZ7_9BACL|nr:hypothetical protein [Paenibacillus profundus]